MPLVLLGTSGFAQQHNDQNLPHGCAQAITVKQSRPFIHKVWDKSRWERGSPEQATIVAWRSKLHCAGPANREAMVNTWQRERLRFGRHRVFRQVAPYAGGGTYWAIPWYIVSCESGGSWSAANPSGAIGPYQLLGWGAPYPAVTWHEKMENHRIASEVWAGGSGAGNWVCA